jgi:hypothetical protein
MRARQKYVNFLVTTIAPGSSILAAQTAGTFDILNKSVDGYTLADGTYEWWAMVDYGSITTRELFRITSVSNKTVTWDKRVSPNGAFNHPSGSSVQLNDVAEMLNYLAQNTDDFGWCEVSSNLNVKVRGGYLAYNVIIPDATLTLPNNSSGWIVWDYAARNFSVQATIVEPNTFIPQFAFTTLAGAVTVMTDVRGPVAIQKTSGSGLKVMNDMGAYVDPVLTPPGTLLAGIDNMSAPIYDSYDRLTSFTADGKNYTITYIDDQFSTITDGTNIWTASYDALGRLSLTIKT